MAVQLGVAVAVPTMKITQFPLGKAGGSPLWLIPDGPNSCPSCANALNFILQVYCPLEPAYTFHRYLYVFMCSICKEMLVYRAQLAQVNPLYPETIEELKEDEDLSDDQLLEMMTQLTNPKPKVEKSDLELEIVEENPEITRAVKELFTLNLQDSQALEDFYDNLPEDTSGPKVRIETSPEAVDDAEIDALDSMIKDHHKFEEDVSFELVRQASIRERKQCIRYDRGGVPLWYSDKNRPILEPTNCEMCGGRRIFEFQLMPQVIDIAGLETDFGSVYIYTCENSCDVGGYLKEVCFVQESL